MTAIEHIQVVASVLSAMDAEGPDFARCCDQQSTALCKMLGKYKKITVQEKLSLIAAVRGLRMTGVAKNRLLERVNGIYAIGAAAASRKRPLQDYHSWPNFGTRTVWADVLDNPPVASEYILQHLNSLGLICPSETTSVSITAHILVAEMGMMAATISGDTAQDKFNVVKKRLKGLYTSEPGEYIVKLPASPALLLSQYPISARVFSRENLPVSCPLNPVWVQSVVAKLNCRDRQCASDPSANAGMQVMMHMMNQFQRFMSVPPGQDAHLNRRPRNMLTDGQEPSAGPLALTNLKINISKKISVPCPKSEALAIADIGRGETTQPNEPSEASPTKAPEPPTPSTTSPAEAPKSPLASSLLDQSPQRHANAGMRSSVLDAQSKLLDDRKAIADANKKTKAAAKAAVKAAAKAASTEPSKQKGAAKPPMKKTKPSKQKGAAKPPMKKTKPSRKINKGKPKSWIKVRPTGCSRCRHRPGCTPSCYTYRGERMPR